MSIRDLGVDFQAYRATAKDYKGWFVSSDDELNRIWYSGAYTVQINIKLARPARTARRPHLRRREARPQHLDR